MAKLIHEPTVTIENGSFKAVYTAEKAMLPDNAFAWPDGAELYIDLRNYQIKPLTIPFQTDQENSEDPHTTKVRQHTGVILDVLKSAETTRLNSALKREKFEAELAAQERADRIALTLAVHNAIQAGVQEEEVTETLRDDHCCYVADMFEKVYLAVDLDTVLNRP